MEPGGGASFHSDGSLYVSPDGADAAAGTEGAPLRSLQQAADLAAARAGSRGRLANGYPRARVRRFHVPHSLSPETWVTIWGCGFVCGMDSEYLQAKVH
eukprot:gene17165-biopygen2923